jgi:hypothetical protein
MISVIVKTAGIARNKRPNDLAAEGFAAENAALPTTMNETAAAMMPIEITSAIHITRTFEFVASAVFTL